MPRLVLDEPEVKRTPRLVLDEPKETPKLILDEEEPDLFKTLAPTATKLVAEAAKPFLFQKPEIVKKGEAQLGREALMFPSRVLTPAPAGLTEAIRVGKKEGILPAIKAGIKTAGKAFLKPMEYPAPELALTEEIFPIQPFEQREYGKLGWIGNVPRAVSASMIQVLGWRVADNLMRIATTRALNPTEIEGITEAYGRALAKMPENVRQNVMPTGNLARVLLGQEQRVPRPWVSKALGVKLFEAPKPSVKLAGVSPIEKPALIKPQAVTPEPTMPTLPIAPKVPEITPILAVKGVTLEGEEIAPKVIKARKPPKSLIGYIVKQGGINPKSLYEMDTKWKEQGLLGISRKGGPGLDEHYSELVSSGIILPAPEDVNPSEWVYQQILESKGQLLNKLDTEDKLIEEYKNQVEEAYGEFTEAEIEQAEREAKAELEKEEIAETIETIEQKTEVQQIIPGAEAKFPESKIPATKYDLIQEKTELENLIEKQKLSFLKPSYSMEEGELPPTGKMVGKIIPGQKIAPPITATGKPIEFEKTEPWKVNLGRNIEGVFEREIGPKLQVSKRLKKWLGVYYSMLGESGTIRVRSLADEKVLNHETGHFLDDVLGNYPIERNKDVRDELIALTKFRTPFTETYVEVINKETGLPIISRKTGKPLKKLDAYSSYRRSKKELFAEFIAEYTSNPQNAKRLTPKFTARVEAEIAKDNEFKYVIDKLREFEKEFKPIKDYVNTLRKIPEIQPFLKDWEEKGNLFQNLWRNYVGNVIWNKLTGAIDKLGEKPVAREFFEKGGLNNQVFEILRQRKKLIDGQRQRLEEEIIKPLSKKTPEDQQYIAETLQRLEIGKATDKELDLLTENARKELSVWGNEARKLGLLNDATFWNNVGQYFPYFYEVKDFEQNKIKFGFFPSKKIKANLSGLKHKLTDEEMGRRVLEAQLGTWPSSKAKIAQYSKEQLEIIGRQAREDMGLIKTAAYPLQKRLFQMIEAVYTVKAFNQIAKIPGIIGDKTIPGFVQLPDAKKFGVLAGQYVPENLAREVNSWNTMLGDVDKVLQVTNAVWKNLKVPFSSSANVRNLVSNGIMAYFYDIPIYNPKVVFGGIKSFATRDEVYKVLRDNGLYRHTYSQEELQKLAFLIEKDPENALEKAFEMAVKVFKTPGDIYGFMEDMSKTIIARYVLDNKGTVEQAVKFADKILFDYSSVSKVVGGARKGFLPFITWSAKVFPRLIETAIRKPEKYIMIALLVAAQAEIARRMLGITKEEEESLKPDSIKKHLAILVPWRDVNNDIQWIDLTYFMPFGGWLPIQKGKLAIPTTLMIGNPLFAFYNAFVLNHDPYLGEIAPDYATDEEKTRLQWKYLSQSLLPDVAYRTPSKIIKSTKGLPDKYGRKSELWKVIAGEIAGVRFTSDISAYKHKIKSKAKMNYHLGRRSIYERYKTGEITKDEKRRLFIKQRQKVKEELSK